MAHRLTENAPAVSAHGLYGRSDRPPLNVRYPVLPLGDDARGDKALDSS